MRTQCEKCTTELNHQSEAYICSYECTYCSDCFRKLKAVCPNCSGELVIRPKRKPTTE
ncbi:DUF1272 domain-containing protein [Flavobacterium sp. GCM10027622]